jgi:serine/threonine protein kinase
MLVLNAVDKQCDRQTRTNRNAMFESGQLFQERYQLQHKLGRSPQGRQTWLAVDSATNPPERVVLKLLVFSEMKWHELKLFEREAQVLKNLAHPRIPKYRDYFFVDSSSQAQLCWWGLVQDYVPGRSLQDLLDLGTRWTEKEVCRIAEDVLLILSYLHGLNPSVLHRDIKPSNLILDDARQIWLVDFGAVQDRAAVTGVSFTVVGTIGYAPLEQFWGRPVASSDLYALGVTLIHLLTGVAPIDLPQRNLRIHFSSRVNIKTSLVRWIEALSEPALEKRFVSADAALKALKQGMPDSASISGIQAIRSSQSICSSQLQKVQKINPQVVVKQKTSKALQIEARQSLPSTSNRNLFMLFYVATGFIAWALLTILQGLWAFVLAITVAYCLVMAIAWHRVRREASRKPKSITFDTARNSFDVETRSQFPSQRESGSIAQIRYISITSLTQGFGQSSDTVWAVIIRTTRDYKLNWGLTEDECIWLVNEIQSWLSESAP